MLTIHFGELEEMQYGPSWFKYNYKPEWLKDPFVQEMIKGVDSSDYIDGLVINSPVLGPIPPERLSGGVKTLIMIYKRPDLVFDATSCGQNCAKWLQRIGGRVDVRVCLEYLMELEDPVEVMIDNENRVVRDKKDFMLTAMKYI